MTLSGRGEAARAAGAGTARTDESATACTFLHPSASLPWAGVTPGPGGCLIQPRPVHAGLVQPGDGYGGRNSTYAHGTVPGSAGERTHLYPGRIHRGGVPRRA